jgi:hypothetical protein
MVNVADIEIDGALLRLTFGNGAPALKLDTGALSTWEDVSVVWSGKAHEIAHKIWAHLWLIVPSAVKSSLWANVVDRTKHLSNQLSGVCSVNTWLSQNSYE